MHFFASSRDSVVSFSVSWRFIFGSVVRVSASRQHASTVSMIAAAGLDAFGKATCDSRTLRAEIVPAGQSRATLGESMLSSRHAPVFALVRERSRDRDRHSRRRPLRAQIFQKLDAAAGLFPETRHLPASTW